MDNMVNIPATVEDNGTNYFAVMALVLLVVVVAGCTFFIIKENNN